MWFLWVNLISCASVILKRGWFSYCVSNPPWIGRFDHLGYYNFSLAWRRIEIIPWRCTYLPMVKRLTTNFSRKFKTLPKIFLKCDQLWSPCCLIADAHKFPGRRTCKIADHFYLIFSPLLLLLRKIILSKGRGLLPVRGFLIKRLTGDGRILIFNF